MNRPHAESAERYFALLARQFPVMCASDEFHFLPRAQSAADHCIHLDDLSVDGIGGIVGELRSFILEWERTLSRTSLLEDRIDLELLIASANGALLELDHKKIWKHNPLVYLKIAFIGLDHALTKPCALVSDRADRIKARLNAMPRLFGQAIENLREMPSALIDAARAMIADSGRYLKEIEPRILSIDKRPSALIDAMERAGKALMRIDHFLDAATPVPNRQWQGGYIEESLKKHFLYFRSLEDIVRIAEGVWADTLTELEKLAAAIGGGATWQSLYHGYCPPQTRTMATQDLYRAEVDRLQRFFGDRDFPFAGEVDSVSVVETPAYLRSVRSSASFAAALTNNARERNWFYITLPQQSGRAPRADQQLALRFKREYRFLTAHETIPGHLLLDSARRRNANPIRRQIESPLFYEGWATYAETLTKEYGEEIHALDRLVDLKRRLWRAARCAIDAGTGCGRMAAADGIALLVNSGFSREEASLQVDRYGLNPGYQLCYCIGWYEFRRLRDAWRSTVELNAFHRIILEGGELPFHSIERRLEALDASPDPADRRS